MMGGNKVQQQVQQPEAETNGPNCQQQKNGETDAQAPATPLLCIRQGCPNPAVTNSEWEDEYCSNECVVTHCRDVFNSWVASNQTVSQT